MAHIALVRIDDRLIHGQVVVKWLRHLGCRLILVADDELWHDTFMQNVLRLAAPAGVQVRVVPVHGAARQLNLNGEQEPRVLLLLRSPQAALALLEDGVSFGEVNLGGLGAGPGTVRLYKSVSANDQQLAALRKIQSRGVRVYAQMVPEERPVELDELLPAYQVASQGAQ